jgi:uncharacterized membrane protein
MNWKKHIKRIPLAIAAVFSIFAGGFILYDIYRLESNNITPTTMTYLSVALIFIGITMIILMNDIYKMEK